MRDTSRESGGFRTVSATDSRESEQQIPLKAITESTYFSFYIFFGRQPLAQSSLMPETLSVSVIPEDG